MSIKEKILNLLSRIVSKDQVLGQCVLLHSFLSLASSIDDAIRVHISYAIQHGTARPHNGGLMWSIGTSGNKPIIIEERILAEYPIFHAILEDDNKLLLTLNWTGGVWFNFSSPIADLSKVKVLSLILPSVPINSREAFYWGVCPSNPKFVLERREAICLNIARVKRDSDCDLVDSTREYFLGASKSVVGIYVAFFDLAAGPSGVAISQYFLGDCPKDSDPVLLVEADHTVLIDTVNLKDLETKIRFLS